MSVEGVRAWIGEVERKLARRTRVFLVLAVVAIGVAAASLYLAIDYRNSSVSEGDVRALQEKLETRIDEVAAGGATTTPTVPPVETEPETAPQPQPEESKPKPNGGNKSGNGASGGASNGATGSVPGGATGGAANSAQIQELIEAAKKKQAGAGKTAP